MFISLEGLFEMFIGYEHQIESKHFGGEMVYPSSGLE